MEGAAITFHQFLHFINQIKNKITFIFIWLISFRHSWWNEWDWIKMYYNSKYNEIKDKSIQQFLKIWRIEEIEWIELLNDWVMLAGQPKETVQWINEWTKWKKLIYCCFRGGSVIWFLWWVGCSFLWWVMPAAGGMGLRQREGTATSNPSMKAMELKAKQREWNEWKKREEMNGMELN